ncbi:MAG: hypothetical protein AB7Q00_14585 [Phycisphaerales bacterium]
MKELEAYRDWLVASKRTGAGALDSLREYMKSRGMTGDVTPLVEVMTKTPFHRTADPSAVRASIQQMMEIKVDDWASGAGGGGTSK